MFLAEQRIKNEYHSFFDPNFSLTIEKIIIKFAHFYFKISDKNED